jgi:hypothetical protein
MSDDDDIARLVSMCFANDSTVRIGKTSSLATLWAGMGKIVKVNCISSSKKNVAIIIKRIAFPMDDNLSIGDSRKVASYDVEATFYEAFSAQLIARAKYNIVPGCALVDRSLRSSGLLSICMTELPGPTMGSFGDIETAAAIRAIALLHSEWFGRIRSNEAVAGGLQPQGGYWYLDTRPDEFDAMPRRGWEGRLRKSAAAIDERLKADPAQCIIHGDLKGVNMALHTSQDTDQPLVSFCDFQYCGQSCAMKDLAYFMVVNLGRSLETTHDSWLALYHSELCSCLSTQSEFSSTSALPSLEGLQDALELSYADVCRWMAGWGYWGNTRFLQARVVALLDRLDNGTELPSADDYREAIIRAYPLLA